MTKPELGTKQDCPECGARFYDLHKDPAHCPKCHHDFVPEALLKPRKTRAEEEQKPEAEENEGEIEAKDAETSLEDAEEENKAPTGNRKGALDEEIDDEDDDAAPVADDENIPELAAIGVELDDNEEDSDSDVSLLVDDDDDDVGIVIKPTGDDD